MLRKPKPEDLKLNNEINAVLDSMSVYGPDSPEYPKLLEHLEKLQELRKARRASWKPSPDQLLLTAGNLLSVGIIVGYEHLHVITSKALPIFVKGK